MFEELGGNYVRLAFCVGNQFKLVKDGGGRGGGGVVRPV